ncbi:MAG: hypothetical protein ACSLFB_01790 [Acidimicrobiales bacterium]
MNNSATVRSFFFSLTLLTLTLLTILVLGTNSLVHAQEVPPSTDPTTPPTNPTTTPIETTTTVAATSPTEAPSTSATPKETTPPKRREPAPTTKPPFVPPAGVPDVNAPKPPGSGPLNDAGTRYLPLMVFLSLGGLATTAAIMAFQYYRTRPDR